MEPEIKQDLRALQTAQGAHLTNYAGQSAVADFGKPDEEYRAVRTRVGVLDLTWRKVMRFTGPDRAAFLHGMTTNHVLGLEPGQVQWNTCCDPTGHLLGVFRLANTGDALWATMHPGCAEGVFTSLDRHLIMDEVEIAEIHAGWGILSLQGPLAPEIGGAITNLDLSDPAVREWRFQDSPAVLVPAADTGENGTEFIVPQEALAPLWATLTSAAENAGGGAVGLDPLQTLRIEAGTPWWGEDLDGSLLMLEASMEAAIHYNKGCYLGQETLARIHFRGHTNRQIVGMKLDLPNEQKLPTKGTRLHPEDTSDREAGWITSAVRSPALGQPIALGVVRREYLNPGAALQCDTGQDILPNARAPRATVTALPFLPPEDFSHRD